MASVRSVFSLVKTLLADDPLAGFFDEAQPDRPAAIPALFDMLDDGERVEAIVESAHLQLRADFERQIENYAHALPRDVLGFHQTAITRTVIGPAQIELYLQIDARFIAPINVVNSSFTNQH